MKERHKYLTPFGEQTWQIWIHSNTFGLPNYRVVFSIKYFLMFLGKKICCGLLDDILIFSKDLSLHERCLRTIPWTQTFYLVGKMCIQFPASPVGLFRVQEPTKTEFIAKNLEMWRTPCIFKALWMCIKKSSLTLQVYKTAVSTLKQDSNLDYLLKSKQHFNNCKSFS